MNIDISFCPSLPFVKGKSVLKGFTRLAASAQAICGFVCHVSHNSLVYCLDTYLSAANNPTEFAEHYSCARLNRAGLCRFLFSKEPRAVKSQLYGELLTILTDSTVRAFPRHGLSGPDQGYRLPLLKGAETHIFCTIFPENHKLCKAPHKTPRKCLTPRWRGTMTESKVVASCCDPPRMDLNSGPAPRESSPLL